MIDFIQCHSLLTTGKPHRSRAVLERLAQCRAALNVPAPDKALIESVGAFMQRVAQVDITRCTCCAHGRFHIIGVIAPVRMQFHHAT